jgi:hypothetical protein
MNKRKEYGMLLDKINASASKSELLQIKTDADTLYKQGCLKINEINNIIQLTI